MDCAICGLLHRITVRFRRAITSKRAIAQSKNVRRRYACKNCGTTTLMP
jgi:transcriptional regulator NrdR family protein